MNIKLYPNIAFKHFTYSFALLISFSAFPIIAEDCRTGNPEVYFIAPEKGAELTSPVKVIFGLKNFNISPAGVDKCDSGHHHLIIDADIPNLEMPIPSSQNYIHFGRGQVKTEIVLSPGKHSLRLLMGNFAHMPQFYSERIEIEVKPIK